MKEERENKIVLSKDKEKRDVYYGLFLSAVIIIVTLLYYNPFVGDNAELHLQITLIVIGGITFIILGFLIKIISRMEIAQKKNKGISSILLGVF
ncbi:hypothetical protein ACFSKI_21395 [Pseudogracilibacillus auburnensis]|uniref:YrhC-like protein n=1 Tax=Pseudogracilibacillus auburnensis TaxID=1494959 RepID=A0A2V3VNN7_9BACI|nr:hypothetical protein [Pseudogracilibacillus auburnensis]PXW81635.1 hypothetical protein DFR56_1208 [Pseudogracilibacillus auburnensis]